VGFFLLLKGYMIVAFFCCCYCVVN